MDSQKRILLLLKKLNRGEIIDTKNDELWINEKDDSGQNLRLSDKTIKRDFDFIKEIFDELEIYKVENNRFKATNTKILAGLLDKKERTALKIIYAMLEQNSLQLRKNLAKTEVEGLVNSTLDSYKFITKPIEMALDPQIVEMLEKAIKRRQKLIIDYTPTDGSEMVKFNSVKPYKILLIDENLYLACSNEMYEFSLFRIAGIKKISEIKKGFFNRDSYIVDFIEHIQTSFVHFHKDWRDRQVRVVLEIAKQKAFLFEKKKFFPSQNIIKRKNNGNIVVEYHFSDIVEIELFILKFLGFVKIIAPDFLKTSILQRIQRGKDFL